MTARPLHTLYSAGLCMCVEVGLGRLVHFSPERPRRTVNETALSKTRLLDGVGQHIRQLQACYVGTLVLDLDVFARQSALMVLVSEHQGPTLIDPGIRLPELEILLAAACLRHHVANGVLVVGPPTISVQHRRHAVVVRMEWRRVAVQMPCFR